MPGADLLLFAGVMALGQFSPGPDMLWLTRVSLRDGARAGVLTALGIACGLAVHSTLALSGLAILLHRHEGFRLGFTLAAAAYLGWLAVRILREPAPAGGAGDGTTVPAAVKRPFLRGLLCNLANPKAAIFLGAVCTPFLESAPGAGRAVALWLIIVLQGGILWAAWARFLQVRRARAFYQRHARRIDAAFAVVLLGLVAWLLVRAATG